MQLSLLQHSKDTCPRTIEVKQALELIRNGNNLAMPICSVAAILKDGYRQKDIIQMTGLSVVCYTNLESGSAAELREEARADPHTLLLFGTADTLNIIFSYELDREYELSQQKIFYNKAFDFGCDYYDQLMGLKACRTDKGRMVQLVHDSEACYNTYAEPFYAWEIKEANQAKREGKKPRGQPKERKPNWQELYASVQDIRDFLSANVYLRRNVITRRVEYRKPDDDADWRPIDDCLVNSLWSKMSAEKMVRVQDMFRVIESDYVQPFNPFTHYLANLKPWDGCNAILALSLTVMVKGGEEKQHLFYECLRVWLVAMVAGWIDPNSVNHEILVFIGEQGSYKTTWFQYLLPPQLRNYFYTKIDAINMNRDNQLILAQYGLICLEELDTMKQKDLNELKGAVTMKTIDVRPAYGRYHEHLDHIASFCGTGNNMRFLTDPSGNRRWLPFEIDYIHDPRTSIKDWDDIYAEAYALYLKGFEHWLSRKEINIMNSHNEVFEAPKSERELIALRFRVPKPGETIEFVTGTEIMQAIGWNPSLRLNIDRIAPAMASLGFEYKQSGSEYGYEVYRYSDLEVKENQRKRAKLAVDKYAPHDKDDTIF